MARRFRSIVAAAFAVTLAAQGLAAEKFRRLTGAQIQARFAGMELSDGVHWRDRYARDGTLTSQSMGRPRSGKWHVDNDQLCLDLGADSGGCYEVWLAGSKVEFRREGIDGAMLEGNLARPASGRQTTREPR
ncbi:MAG: hypothetical protein K2Y27_02715 [Xanthobacteraceae bacterium]|nr:hypothetical protein [Xanthobacteraceae bacterium]